MKKMSFYMLAACLAALAPLVLAFPGYCEVVDRIVAVVNDEVVTMSEVQGMARAMEAQAGVKATKKQDQELQRKMLDNLIDRKLARAEAKKKGINVPAKEVAAALEEFKKRSNLNNDADFNKALAQEGLTLKEFKRQIEEQILQERLISVVMKDKAAPVSDAEVRKVYDTQIKGGSSRMHLRSIKMPYPPDATEAQKDELRKKAESVMKEIQQGGDFQQVAKKYSVEATDVGFMAPGDLDPNLAAVLARLKDKEVAPVQTPQGFQLIQVAARQAGEAKPFEEVAPKIRSMLMQQHMEKQFSEWVKTLRDKAHIKIML
jgi:peptidyl-prolyl cis-trans isomerase SurA